MGSQNSFSGKGCLTFIIIIGVLIYRFTRGPEDIVKKTKFNGKVTVGQILDEYVVDQKWNKYDDDYYVVKGKIKIKNKLEPFQMAFAQSPNNKDVIFSPMIKIKNRPYHRRAAEAFLDTCYEEYMKEKNKK